MAGAPNTVSRLTRDGRLDRSMVRDDLFNLIRIERQGRQILILTGYGAKTHLSRISMDGAADPGFAVPDIRVMGK